MRLRSTIWSTFLLFVLLAAVGHAAQFMELQVEPTKIVLELAKAEGQSYRVWHTTNPMKVIVDSPINILVPLRD